MKYRTRDGDEVTVSIRAPPRGGAIRHWLIWHDLEEVSIRAPPRGGAIADRDWDFA